MESKKSDSQVSQLTRVLIYWYAASSWLSIPTGGGGGIPPVPLCNTAGTFHSVPHTSLTGVLITYSLHIQSCMETAEDDCTVVLQGCVYVCVCEWRESG